MKAERRSNLWKADKLIPSLHIVCTSSRHIEDSSTKQTIVKENENFSSHYLRQIASPNINSSSAACNWWSWPNKTFDICAISFMCIKYTHVGLNNHCVQLWNKTRSSCNIQYMPIFLFILFYKINIYRNIEI